jgi:hypothetical protein
MHETTLLDRLRALAEGRLAPSERAALERELAADPRLAGLADDYLFVHGCTAADPIELHPRLSFEALEQRLAPRRARRVAAAAAVLLVAGAAFWAGRASAPRASPLRLSAIELDSPPIELAPAEVPLEWASYDPRGTEGVRFLRDRGEAELLASALERPLLVYGSYPGCPLCKELDARVFADPAVTELSERLVPLRLDLSLLSEAEQRALTSRGYPFLEVWRADGRPAHALARRPDAQAFLESLHDGLEKSEATGEQRPWEDLRSAARRFGAARADELEGRLGEAERGYRALEQDARVPAPIAARARVGRLRIAASARALLLEARASAESDLAAALELLERAGERFSGTSFERDLEAVRERALREGRFPELVEADGSA